MMGINSFVNKLLSGEANSFIDTNINLAWVYQKVEIVSSIFTTIREEAFIKFARRGNLLQ
jgi:hypothetical protein